MSQFPTSSVSLCDPGFYVVVLLRIGGEHSAEIFEAVDIFDLVAFTLDLWPVFLHFDELAYFNSVVGQ